MVPVALSDVDEFSRSAGHGRTVCAPTSRGGRKWGPREPSAPREDHAHDDGDGDEGAHAGQDVGRDRAARLWLALLVLRHEAAEHGRRPGRVDVLFVLFGHAPEISDSRGAARPLQPWKERYDGVLNGLPERTAGQDGAAMSRACAEAGAPAPRSASPAAPSAPSAALSGSVPNRARTPARTRSATGPAASTPPANTTGRPGAGSGTAAASDSSSRSAARSQIRAASVSPPVAAAVTSGASAPSSAGRRA